MAMQVGKGITHGKGERKTLLIHAEHGKFTEKQLQEDFPPLYKIENRLRNH
jgi:hypothetical protein